VDRLAERRRAVALAVHYREAEGLSIAQIADRLGRSPATIKAYFYDPTGEKARAVKAWTRELVIAAMLEWRERYGRLPSSYDWSRTHARRRGEQALRRLEEGHWPAASVVSAVFRTWAAARQAAAAKNPRGPGPTEQ